MAGNKIQHYVPRCHLKPFSANAAGKIISLYNIASDRLIHRAAVRHQCAKDYLYGRDGDLERAFQPMEGHYATVIRNLEENQGKISNDELSFLKDFALIQSTRSDAAANRLANIEATLLEPFVRRNIKIRKEMDSSPQKIMLQSLRLFPHSRKVAEDLKCILVQNGSSSEFVTSDDPAIQINRYHAQRIKTKTYGLGSSGATLVLPLTPTFLLVCYDRLTYMVPNCRGNVVKIGKAGDVEALNSLQYIRASNNIYFSNWNSAEKIRSETQTCLQLRRVAWNRINFMVPEKEEARGTHYRRATEKDLEDGREFLAINSAVFPEPQNWFSELKWHPKPRVYKTNTGAGILRPTSSAIERYLSWE